MGMKAKEKLELYEKLLQEVVSGCMVFIEHERRYGGGYNQCPFCCGEDDHHKKCLYNRINKALGE
jgi:hypothetical protein